MQLSVAPISQVREREQKRPKSEENLPIDSKVRGFVLERIGSVRGALLPSASAPQIISLLLPGYEGGKMEFIQKKRKKGIRKTPYLRKVPIGLMSVDPEGWVNALMQFLIYVPGFAEGLVFAPKSLMPIQEFIDQYFIDIQEGRSVSFADGGALWKLFVSRFPNQSLRDIFESLTHLIKPRWELLKSYIEALKNGRAADLFLTATHLQKQLCIAHQYFDLNAFIEKRPDGKRVNYIAYVKLDGCWYQCDEMRVTQIRSDILGPSLERSVLSYYRKVF